MSRPEFKLPPPVKISIPTGALMDIPTGIYIRGTHDQRVLLGGAAFVTGIVGPGNSFKSTIMNFMEFSLLNRIIMTVDDTWGLTYDTETNTNEHRKTSLSRRFKHLAERDVVDEGIWMITDKTVYSGNEYFMALKKSLKDKREQKNPKLYPTAFLSRDKVTPLMVMAPTIGDIDSLSKFTTSDVDKMLESVELGDSAGNTAFMRQGLGKSKMLLEIPSMAAGSMHYFFFTAHIGKKIDMAQGPMAPKPRKQLQYLPAGDEIKGVTNDFFYLLLNCWFLHQTKPLLNKDNPTPLYPYEPGDEEAGDNDLNIVTMRQLRGKNGESGFDIRVIVSQNEGVLASLSEFHYIKEMDRYGLEGNNVTYSLALYPDVKIGRTTIRKKLREDEKLCRAVEITSQLCQIEEFHREIKDQIMSPAELYTALKDKGYDWDFLLSETRSWHTIDDERYPGYPFSTLDMCRAARGEYHPYWLESDNKTVKKEYKEKKIHHGS
jgi:hypothetical protein